MKQFKNTTDDCSGIHNLCQNDTELFVNVSF